MDFQNSGFGLEALHQDLAEVGVRRPGEHGLRIDHPSADLNGYGGCVRIVRLYLKDRFVRLRFGDLRGRRESKPVIQLLSRHQRAR